MPVSDDVGPAILMASYWGKADPNVATLAVSHHTVLGHSLDVAACAFVLVDCNPVLRSQFSRRVENGMGTTALTCAALCALHDVGKLDTRFQRKAPHVADALRPYTSSIHRGTYDHGVQGYRQVEDDEAAHQLLLSRLGTSALSLLRAVCGHHGVLPARDLPDASRVELSRSIRREDARARICFIESVTTFFVERGAALPCIGEVDSALVQRLSGLCAISDWIGSDVQHFPYSSGPIFDLDGYWAAACARAVESCRQAGLLRASFRPTSFGALFPGYVPRDVQCVAERIAVSEPALVIVEAEMGKGKTEAALSLAARFLACRIADGVTIALPTMATSNAMFKRTESISPRMFEPGHLQVALAHGRAARQNQFRSLIERGLRAHDSDAPEASVMCARWLLQKKRILLAQIGVGTVDQALQAALTVRHQFVRMFALSRNVVIIDEVHAYDAYMEVLLEHLLRWLGALDVPVVLLSATLPSDRRAALQRAWRDGCEASRGRGAEENDDLEAARARPYPLVSATTRSGTTLSSSEEPASTRVVSVARAVREGQTTSYEETVITRLLAAAHGGARVVWIRNTVREAQRAFGAVAARAQGIEHILFHARFRGCDRSKIEENVLEQFGKSAPSGGRVLIATQVVEQSLDLDFDELHSDLAPIDLLLQRVGRLHRHDRARPAGFEGTPRLIVHVPSEEDCANLHFGPSSFVYDVGTLWIANRALCGREVLSLPDDIRSLVEESYHPASRAALLSLGGPVLVAAEAVRASALEAKRTKAKQCCIPPTSADPDGGAALDDDEDAVQAFTRDGTSATLLPFWWDGEHARSLDAEDGAKSWQLDAGSSGAGQLAGELFDQTLSLPARGEVSAEPATTDGAQWDAWRKRFVRFANESGMRRVVPLPMKREGSFFKGWLRMGGRRRRVVYSATLGLLMPSEKDEKEAR